MQRRPHFRSLASKFSIFTGVLVLWVVVTILCWDVRQHTFDTTKGIVLCGIVGVVAGAISRFTMKLLARPLALLQAGITSVREGRFEPIQVSPTGDEIQYLGESFNRMIETLEASRAEIREHQELLEQRIRQRTEDLERAMHAALAASQAKSEFLANMSHELRTPMNGLLGMLDLVLDSSLPSDQREQLETAQRCAYSLLALLNDILDLSKIEAGKMLLEKIPFNVSEVLTDCVKAQAAKAQQKHIDLKCEVDPSTAAEVLGDPLRVRQIVANLLSNAIKFTERGSVLVKLASRDLGNGRIELELRVTDTGSGIPSDKLPFIFEKFTQADGSITRKYGGTGLGLAITKRLVQIQGGEIHVASEVGKGSTFLVTILCEAAPAKPAEVAPANAKPADAASPAASSARLLVVEDNLVNQKVVLAILRKKGYQIDVANHGKEALTKLEAPDAAYNLILMDVQMPILDGLEATRTIRRNERWSGVPIIAMTAHAMNGDRERCLQAGMDAYISKPVQPAHLISTIEKQLANPISPRALRPVEQNVEGKLRTDDSGLVSGILQLFLQIAPERMHRLESAVHSSDSETLQQEARMIGAAAKQLSSAGLGDCARKIEAAASRNDFDQVRRDLEALGREIRFLESVATSGAAQ